MCRQAVPRLEGEAAAQHSASRVSRAHVLCAHGMPGCAKYEGHRAPRPRLIFMELSAQEGQSGTRVVTHTRSLCGFEVKM